MSIKPIELTYDETILVIKGLKQATGEKTWLRSLEEYGKMEELLEKLETYIANSKNQNDPMEEAIKESLLEVL